MCFRVVVQGRQWVIQAFEHRNFIFLMLKWINSSRNKPVPKQTQKDQQEHDPDLLPGTLASRILDLEFQSQTEAINRELIANLSCLYIQAVEYYQSRSNQKFKIYHKRMETFLKRAAVDDILKGKSGVLVNRKESAEQMINSARNKSKSEVTKIIEKTNKKAEKHMNMVSKTLEEQNLKLEARIHKRRTMSNRSISSEREEDLPEQSSNPFKFQEVGLQLHKLNSSRQPKRVFI